MDRTYPILEEVVQHFKYKDAVYVTSTTGGTHAPGSYHYRGEAVDFGVGNTPASKAALQRYGKTRWEVMDEFAAYLYARSPYITELIHTHRGDTGGYYVNHGVRVHHGAYGRATDLAHEDHVHLAVASKAAADKLVAALKDNSPSTVVHPALPTLRKGAKGSAVKTLQADLNRKGANLDPDGVFGDKTAAAVHAFQVHEGLLPDGVVGPKTWGKLR